MRRTLISDPQSAVGHFDFRRCIAGDPAEPILPLHRIDDAVLIAQFPRRSALAIRGRQPACQRHADLRAEARAQPQGIAHRISAAAREIQQTQLRIDFFEIGHRRHNAGFQNLHRHHVFDADCHGMAGAAFGVGHHDLIGRGLEHVTQGKHLGGGAAAARRRVGLVGDKDQLRRNFVATDAPGGLGAGDEFFHHADNVTHIQPAAVIGAVDRNRAEDFADRLQAAFAGRVERFHHQRGAAHADDQAVAPAVKGNRRIFHFLIRGGRAGGEKTRAKPFHEIVGGHIIRGENDDAAATAGLNPILGHGHCLGGAGTRAVGADVGAARADVFRKLGMPHVEHAEKEAPVKVIGMRLDFGLQARDAALEFSAQSRAAVGLRALLQTAQLFQAFAANAVLIISGDDPGQGVHARKGRSENHTGFVAHFLGQHPAIGQLRAPGGGLVAHYQRNAGITQRLDAGGNRELRDDVERAQTIFGIAEVMHQIQRFGPCRELDHLAQVLNDFEPAVALRGFHQPRDVFVDHCAAERHGHRPDELVAAQHALDIGIIEDALHAG